MFGCGEDSRCALRLLCNEICKKKMVCAGHGISWKNDKFYLNKAQWLVSFRFLFFRSFFRIFRSRTSFQCRSNEIRWNLIKSHDAVLHERNGSFFQSVIKSNKLNGPIFLALFFQAFLRQMNCWKCVWFWIFFRYLFFIFTANSRHRESVNMNVSDSFKWCVLPLSWICNAEYRTPSYPLVFRQDLCRVASPIRIYSEKTKCIYLAWADIVITFERNMKVRQNGQEKAYYVVW